MPTTPGEQLTRAPQGRRETDGRPAPPTPTPDAFRAAMEAEVCRRVLGDRRHGLTS